MSSLQYASTRKGNKILVRVGGSLDIDNAPTLNRKLGEEIEKGAVKIVVNLAGVEYMSSAGLGAIISNNSKAVKAGGEIRLSCMPEKIARVFALLGFITQFKIYETDEEALDSF